jgi:hypothetical protein
MSGCAAHMRVQSYGEAPHVNSALASLITDGTRDKLVEEWLAPPADLTVYS